MLSMVMLLFCTTAMLLRQKRILIDGGARGTYDNYLKKRLEQIKTDEDLEQGVPLEMVMVSHVDSDHIAGILDLFEDLKSNSAPVTVTKLWHNSFDDVMVRITPNWLLPLLSGQKAE